MLATIIVVLLVVLVTAQERVKLLSVVHLMRLVCLYGRLCI